MAVVKVEYTRSRPRMKAHIRYITYRPGRDREKISRALFDNHGLSDTQRAYHMVDMAPRGTNFFKIVISPDPKREDRYKDLDLPHITRQTILQLEAQIGRHVQFIGTIHNDHTPNRHLPPCSRSGETHTRRFSGSSQDRHIRSALAEKNAGPRPGQSPLALSPSVCCTERRKEQCDQFDCREAVYSADMGH